MALTTCDPCLNGRHIRCTRDCACSLCHRVELADTRPAGQRRDTRRKADGYIDPRVAPTPIINTLTRGPVACTEANSPELVHDLMLRIAVEALS